MNRPSTSRLLIFLLTSGAWVGVSGCKRPVPLKEIATHLEQYKGKEVRVQGQVVSSFSATPLLKESYYVLSDGTAQMVIGTASGLPAKDSTVAVDGTLADMPSLALPAIRQFKLAEVMIQEKERREEPKPKS